MSEKRYAFFYLKRLVFEQISPAHPVSESGGMVECNTVQTKEAGRMEIIVSNIGYIYTYIAYYTIKLVFRKTLVNFLQNCLGEKEEKGIFFMITVKVSSHPESRNPDKSLTISIKKPKSTKYVFSSLKNTKRYSPLRGNSTTRLFLHFGQQQKTFWHNLPSLGLYFIQ